MCTSVKKYIEKKRKTVEISKRLWYNVYVMEMADMIKKAVDTVQNEKKQAFDAFRALLLEYNEKYNLTTILEEKDMFYKHFVDSVVGEGLFSNGASVAEIGSGAGFPSIALKIARPDLSFDLFESVGKKCEFLRVVVEKLGLQKMNIYNIRAEDAARDKNFREQYDFVTARAVARMNTLSEYCLPFVKVGGKFIAYKSGDVTEIQEAESAYKILGAKLLEIKAYSLPEAYGERTLAVVEKKKPTPLKYPRGQGKERKNPL